MRLKLFKEKTESAEHFDVVKGIIELEFKRSRGALEDKGEGGRAEGGGGVSVGQQSQSAFDDRGVDWILKVVFVQSGLDVAETHLEILLTQPHRYFF